MSECRISLDRRGSGRVAHGQALESLGLHLDVGTMPQPTHLSGREPLPAWSPGHRPAAVSEWLVAGWSRFAALLALSGAWNACEPAGPVRSAEADASDSGMGGGSEAGPDAGPAPRWLAYVTSGSSTPELRLLDVAAPGKPPVSLQEGAVDLRWTKDGRWLLAELYGKRSALIDFSASTPGPVLPLELAGAGVHGCVPAQSSKRLACLLDEGTAQAPALVDLSGAKPVVIKVTGPTFLASSYPFTGWSPDSRYALYLAPSGNAYQLLVADAEATAPSATLISSSVVGLKVSPDSKFLAYGVEAPSPGFFLRNLASGSSSQISGDPVSFWSLGWTTQGTAIVYGGAAGLVAYAPATAQSVVVHPGSVGTLMVSPDGTRAAFFAYGELAHTLLDTQFFPPQKLGTLPGTPLCWSPPCRFLAVLDAPLLSLVDLQAPALPPKALSSGNLPPSDCEFQGELGLTWYSHLGNPVLGVATSPAWEGTALDAKTGPFATATFSWSSDLALLAFRDADSGWLTLAEHFPNPTLVELTGVSASAFAFRP